MLLDVGNEMVVFALRNPDVHIYFFREHADCEPYYLYRRREPNLQESRKGDR
jgi:hypothetical protein